MFDWPEQPRRVVVQGAGYIALEFACLLRRLGSDVTVVLRGERVLRGFDDEVREHLQSQLERQGIAFVTRAALAVIEPRRDGLTVTLDSGRVLNANAVLRALGRLPNTAGLGLEAAGVALGADGAVVVNLDGQTSVPHIHAIGDVTDRVQLTPAAIREGQAYAERVFGGRARHPAVAPRPAGHRAIGGVHDARGRQRRPRPRARRWPRTPTSMSTAAPSSRCARPLPAATSAR